MAAMISQSVTSRRLGSRVKAMPVSAKAVKVVDLPTPVSPTKMVRGRSVTLRQPAGRGSPRPKPGAMTAKLAEVGSAWGGKLVNMG